MNNNIEIILKDKINELGEFLLSICENDSKKKDIRDTLIDVPTFKILMFISFINTNKINHQIDDFIILFNLKDSNENRDKIKEYIDYFIQIKNILNE
jgi:hypothetical protein